MTGISRAAGTAMQTLGQNIQNARKRRSLTMQNLAHQMDVSLPTLRKIEAGEGTVLIQHYAAALEALDMIDKLGELGGPGHDEYGMSMANEKLPKRVRQRGKNKF